MVWCGSSIFPNARVLNKEVACSGHLAISLLLVRKKRRVNRSGQAIWLRDMESKRVMNDAWQGNEKYLDSRSVLDRIGTGMILAMLERKSTILSMTSITFLICLKILLILKSFSLLRKSFLNGFFAKKPFGNNVLRRCG